MKKIICIFIILNSLIFSTLNNAFALEEGYTGGEIEDILNLTNGPEIDKLEKLQINTYNFKSSNFLKMQGSMLIYDRKLKDIIEQNYIDGKFSYSKMAGIINEYEFFIYNLNKYLEWNRKIEKYSYLKKDTNVSKFINDSYSQMRTHINRLKYLVYEQN